MENIFFGNVFDNIIIEYLDVRDIYALGFVNKKYQKRFDKHLIMKIILARTTKKLQNIFGEYYDQFVKNMIESNAIIGGSFILQCILNEWWYDSDIDIYVDVKYEHKFHENMKNIAHVDQEDEDFDNYNSVFENIINISSYYIDLDEKDDKIQVISIRTSDKYSLIDHINNTGFDVCKNILKYNNSGKLQLHLKNFRELIAKTSTFIIQDVDDFFHRLEKYSSRGFRFRSKYNKVLCIEYISLRKTYPTLLSRDNTKGVFCYCNNRYEKCSNCDCRSYRCPINTFFPDIKHYHKGMREHVTPVIVSNNSKIYNDILPQLRLESVEPLSLMPKTMEKCKDMDDYAKIRNNFAHVPIDIYNSSDEYDIQYRSLKRTLTFS